MRFLKARFHNLLTIGHAEIYLDGRGLVGIQGKNLDDPSADSVGSGKSSIPDSLSWALWGVTARGVTGDDIINERAKKDAWGEVTLQDGESYYEIRRYRKHKEGKNSVVVYASTGCPPSLASADKVIAMHKATDKETQRVIEQILGCSQEVFMAAIYAGQEAMPDLPSMTDKQLKLLIEEAAGVERIERAYVLAREKAATARGELERIAVKRDQTKERLGSVKASLAGSRLSHEEFERGREGRAFSHETAAVALATEIKTVHAKLLALAEATLRARLAQVAEKLGAHSRRLKDRDALKAQVSTAERQLAVVEAEFKRSAAEVERIAGQIRNAPEEMKKPCPECGKPHTADELKEFVAHLTGKHTAAIRAAQTMNEQVIERRGAVAKLAEQLHAFEATLPDVTDLAREQTDLNRCLSECDALKSQIRLRKKDFDAAKERSATARTEANPYSAAIELQEKQIAELTTLGEGLAHEIERLEARVAIADDVVKVFGPAGVRAHILDTVTPFLNERTADYLSALSDGNITAVWSTLAATAKGELREKFNIEVENSKGANSFRGLSGGEKRKVRLATMMALQDLVASRATKPIDLWICDEVDHALDPAGLERLMGILERRARERGTVLVISHQELSAWIDQMTLVTKQDGVATVSGALCEALGAAETMKA